MVKSISEPVLPNSEGSRAVYDKVQMVADYIYEGCSLSRSESKGCDVCKLRERCQQLHAQLATIGSQRVINPVELWTNIRRLVLLQRITHNTNKCFICKSTLVGKRANTSTCSAYCRLKLFRKRRKLKKAIFEANDEEEADQ